MPLPLELLGLAPEIEGKEEPINVFEISVRAEKDKGQKRIFDPRVDISDDDLEIIFQDLVIVEHQPLAGLPLIFKSQEQKERFLEYTKSSPSEATVKHLDSGDYTFSNQNHSLADVDIMFYDCLRVAMTGRKLEFRHAFENLLNEYVRPKLDSLKDSPYIGNYMRIFGYSRMMFPDEISQDDISDGVLHRFKEGIIQNVKKARKDIFDGNGNGVQFQLNSLLVKLAYYKLVAPDDFKKSRIFEDAKDLVRLKAEELRDFGIRGDTSKGTSKSLKEAEWLSILCADSIECTDRGIELVWDDEEFDTSKADVPKLPSVRKF